MLNTDASVKTLPGGATNPIPVGGTTRADEFCNDPKDNLVMIASPARVAALRHLRLDLRPIKSLASSCLTAQAGHARRPPTASSSAGGVRTTGKFYQNVPEVNGAGNDTSPGAVAVINPKTMKVETTFPVPLADCAGPQGMAIGPDDSDPARLQCSVAQWAPEYRGHQCEERERFWRSSQDLGGADEVWFNPGDGHYVIPSCNTACRTAPVEFALTGDEVLGIVDSAALRGGPTVFVAAQNSDTTVTSGNPRTIHSVAADPNNKQIILPIPAVGGNAPQFAPSLCDKMGSGITVIGKPSSCDRLYRRLGSAVK